MRKRNTRKDGHAGFCPLSCQKYAAVCRENAELLEKNQHLASSSERLDSIFRLNAEELCAIGFERQGEADFVVAMSEAPSSRYDGCRAVYLYRLPHRHRQDWICFMGIHYFSICEAHIYDWSSRIPNHGYGSILMKHLIRFLRTAGFRTLTGTIMETDFDHETKLRYFYEKFGFVITDFPEYRTLCLHLLAEEAGQAPLPDCHICVRDDLRRVHQNEELLKENP